jgi:HAD superfamily hydrolase (TIGR01549 family)
MQTKILAVLLDCGDTLIDEGSEIKDEQGATISADLIPGAKEALLALKASGYRLGLVADGPALTFSREFIQHGMTDLFECQAISELVGCEKPDRRIFEHALDQLGIAPAEYGRVVMVGNNLSRDIKGANELGLVSIWIDWAPRRAKVPADASETPRYTIKNPAELPELIAKLENV